VQPLPANGDSPKTAWDRPRAHYLVAVPAGVKRDTKNGENPVQPPENAGKTPVPRMIMTTGPDRFRVCTIARV
jgi:hypothetical protein